MVYLNLKRGLAKQSRHIMFTSFLFEKLSHLKQFYSSENEFTQHLLSGEVKITIPDLIKFQEEYESRPFISPPNSKLNLPSQFQQGDKALFECKPDGDLSLPYYGIPCEILAVHFYPGKVKYDLDLLFVDNQRSRIYNVDSILVKSL